MYFIERSASRSQQWRATSTSLQCTTDIEILFIWLFILRAGTSIKLYAVNINLIGVRDTYALERRFRNNLSIFMRLSKQANLYGSCCSISTARVHARRPSVVTSTDLYNRISFSRTSFCCVRRRPIDLNFGRTKVYGWIRNRSWIIRSWYVSVNSTIHADTEQVYSAGRSYVWTIFESRIWRVRYMKEAKKI